MPNWSRHQRRLPPETNPGFSSSHPPGSACGWHSTSIVGSSLGRPHAAHTGSAVPATSHTSPSVCTPAPSVAAISSPHPTTTTVSGDSPVASAKAGSTFPTGWVLGTSSGSRPSSRPVWSSTGRDQVRDRGSSRASEDAFEKSTASTPAARLRTYDPGGPREDLRLRLPDPERLERGVGGVEVHPRVAVEVRGRDPLGQRGGLRLRPAVHPDQGRAQRPAPGVAHHDPVEL